ncbi:hypothetical protein I309_01804 [Cryptococcus deuterogattii LA55]|nr:hypothetical protein I309_01804 [Cryptococcus deuterogattii LA55]KIR34104.1 hypothetical protein I352_03338 [Cryptococcus deuterogattii MMRL2647]KIR71753.1 hypothetical protein I310_04432 [Cryptococcus deuterogattii CA1014]KIR91335.1 hypothetical protein I304_04805 [Cryptococcus deuterogattii CBS 10090]KIR98476.1 hypothetical protein L804_04049 [Cryptococcus deuterogattii 2001/935-1]
MKFGRYLQENLTPEWKRAYIDYRACKKSIKVVAARLGQVKEQEDVDGGGSSSGPDDDHGPSAPQLKSPDTLRGSKGSLRDRLGAARNTPRLARFSSRPSENQSPNYGSTSESPYTHASQTAVSNPPPLDLGEPGVDDDYTPSPDSRPDEPHLVSNLEQCKDRSHTPNPKKGVAFSPTTLEIAGQRIEELPEIPSRSQSSEDGKSSDGVVQSDSQEPLTRRPADLIGNTDKTAPSPRLFGRSGKGFLTPKLSSIRGVAAPTSRDGKSPARSIRSMALPSPALGIRSTATSAHPTETFEELYDRMEGDEKAFFDLLQRELDKVEKFYVEREQEAIKRAHDLRVQLRELADHRKLYHEIYPEGIPEWEAKMGRILPNGVQSRAPAFNKLRSRFKYAFDDRENSSSNTNGRPPKDANVASSGSQSPVMSEHERQHLRQAMTEDKEHQTYSPERYQKYKKDLRNAVLEFYRQLELIKNYRIMNLTGFRKALKKFEKVTKIPCLEMYTDERISKCTFSKSEAIDDLIKQCEELYTIHFEHGDSKKARERLRRQQLEKTHYQSVFRSGLMLGIGLPAAIAALVESGRDETRREIPGWQGLLQAYGGLYLPVIFALLFELNLWAYVTARINYEIPAFLFLTLSYCFYFSFARVGSSNVDPTTWPAAWLVFLCVFWLNPLPVLRRGTRYWLLRVMFRVLTPGYSRVEFIAFFLADELNSLVYSIQNIYFIACSYANKWPGNIFTVCPSGRTWQYGVFRCLPALSRLIQCLKRYHDSKLNIHLINDFVIDWSLFRPNAGLLRKDLGYSRRYVYYFAMVSNFLIRFIFVWYIPFSSRNVRLRSFFFALAEMLRRWQWNFFRVETEHLGNADAYRVTREIPLPYRRVDHDSDDESDPHEIEKLKGRSGHPHISINLDRLRRGIRDRNVNEGRGPDALDAGPRGHAPEREYEARRPGDIEERVPTGEQQV